MNTGQKTYEINSYRQSRLQTPGSRPIFCRILASEFEVLSQPVDAQLPLAHARLVMLLGPPGFMQQHQKLILPPPPPISEKDAWSIKPLYQTEEDAGGAYMACSSPYWMQQPPRSPPSSLIDPVSVGIIRGGEDGYGF